MAVGEAQVRHQALPPPSQPFAEDGASLRLPGGEARFIELPQLRVRQLFEADQDGVIDARSALLRLNRELLFGVAELAGALAARPAAYARAVEGIGLVLRNMHHLLNALRAQQAQDTLEHLVATENERKRAAVARVQQKLAQLGAGDRGGEGVLTGPEAAREPELGKSKVAERDPQPASEQSSAAVEQQAPAAEQKGAGMTKVFVIIYSTYGHVYKMAKEQVAGLEAAGVEAQLLQVPETLPDEVLAKMHAAPKPDIPIADPKKLPEADGLLFGFPTRYGLVPAQMKAFWDATGQLWLKGALVGKPVAFFTSTASQGGGQEVTIMTALPFVAALGMIYVSAGYGYGPALFGVDQARGGSGWGAGTFAAGDGSRQPSKDELGHARWQGEYFGKVVKKLAVKE